MVLSRRWTLLGISNNSVARVSYQVDATKKQTNKRKQMNPLPCAIAYLSGCRDL